jgi:hypothetical protein
MKTLKDTLLFVAILSLAACATVFPPEVAPAEEILASRYVTDEQRAMHRNLTSGPLGAEIERQKALVKEQLAKAR